MLLDDVKLALRVTEDDFDTEILDLIEAVKADLKLCGIVASKINDLDPLIKRAITAYCKAGFGYDNPDAGRLFKSYESLKTHLSLSQEYLEE